ncbi:msr9758 (plasmid) [Mesorhizobium japonicum MAFF 303099]|uniref:Msr9758 protein n=1 Tax=Mesorhizobium japonicum (strain LMG 29417 / CECT 9101 / MAFF 303099) TaxID=266835 RepID=Q98P90_RHILO|nr:msr9758 [Mesorhizobium japonicum MAFF 303099]
MPLRAPSDFLFEAPTLYASPIAPNYPPLPSDLHQAPEPDRFKLLADRMK